MSRIRSLKPEWLEDEKLAARSDEARVLSAGLILLADDQGRGRANPAYLASQVWTYHPRESLAKVSQALDELSRIRFVAVYTVGGEQFYEIRNWNKHQKVDHPAKPRLPGPDHADSRDSRESLASVTENLAPDPDPDPDLKKSVAAKNGDPTTWLTPFALEWGKRLGKLPFARAGRMLKPLVDELGADEALRRFAAYCAGQSGDLKKVSLERFAQIHKTFETLGDAPAEKRPFVF